MPCLRMDFPRCQQEPVAPLVQYGHMWRGREGTTLLPTLERARCLLTRTARAHLEACNRRSRLTFFLWSALPAYGQDSGKSKISDPGISEVQRLGFRSWFQRLFLSIHGQPISRAPNENVGESSSRRFAIAIANAADNSGGNCNLSIDLHPAVLRSA